MPRKIVLSHGHSPGDIVVMTALVRDIHLTYPGQFEIAVETPCRSLWANSPYLVSPKRKPGEFEFLRMCYGKSLGLSHTQKVHFLTGFHRDFTAKTKLELPLHYPKPDLHLSDKESSTSLLSGRYWVMVAGGKMDFTTKHWLYDRHQEVVDTLHSLGIGVVQAGAKGNGSDHHFHPKLERVIDFVGKTNLREFIQLIKHSDGVICTITAAMHIAAALDKPCVVTGGGREGWWWEAYHRDNPGLGLNAHLLKVNHRYLHTIGLLDCCQTDGCWKSFVTSKEGKGHCRYPELVGNQTVSKCHGMLSAGKVAEAVLSYYYDGTLTIPEGAMIPDISRPTTLKLPDGRYAELECKLKPAGHVEAVSTPVIAPALSVAVEPNGDKAVFAPANLRPSPLTGIFDNPAVGGNFTICVLLYGDFHDLHKRCLGSILATTPRNRTDLRVGSNALCQESLNYVDDLMSEGKISRHYRHKSNDKKYPVMREMLHDSDYPMHTKWLIWFDDDSICDKSPDWLTLLAEQIARNSTNGYHCFGPVRNYRLSRGQIEWVRKADWFRGQKLRDKTGKPCPNGDIVHFVVGSHFAISTEAVKKCNIPDLRLAHNGGDVMIGEQLYQNGYRIKDWNSNKSILNWSSVKRRGLSERHPAA